MICKICGKTINTLQGLSKHITSIHNQDKQLYYDKYLKVSENEGFCQTCGKPTPFIALGKGYKKHCNCSCAQLDINTPNTFICNNPQKDKYIRHKTINTCRKKYGVDYPLQSEIVKEKITKTLLDKYGVKNPYQQKHIQQKARDNSHTKGRVLKERIPHWKK